LNPPEVEQHLRIDRLRREVDAMARRVVWQTVGAIVVAFLLGAVVGHVVWR
jgi:hypothetical protein